MADYTAKDVQRLRLDAGVGMMDAKTALDETDGDFERAYDLLRERGLAKAAKRAGREAAEGTIGVYVHIQNDRPVMGVVVELACETDFVAKSQEFRQVADDIALHISWANPQWTTRDEVDEAVLQKESDLIARQAQGEGKLDSVIPKIVEGRLEKFYEENVLYEQAFVNAEKFDGSVGDMVSRLAARMGENIAVRRFARLAVGEGA